MKNIFTRLSYDNFRFSWLIHPRNIVIIAKSKTIQQRI